MKYVRVDKREARRLYDDGKTLVMSLDRPWCAMGESTDLSGVTTVTKQGAGQSFEELARDALQWKHRYPGSQGLVWYTPRVESQLQQLAARAAITSKSEISDRDRLMDDYHDLLNSVLWVLEEAGVPLPDPDDPETARTAWA